MSEHENRFNTWEHVAHIRDSLSGTSVDRDWRYSVESMYAEHGEVVDTDHERKMYDNGHSTPIETISLWLESDRTPPPEILYALSDSLTNYLERPFRISLGLDKEDVSLEQAFFGNSKKGAGSYSARILRKIRRPNYERFHKYLLQYRAASIGNPSIEVILKQYREDSRIKTIEMGSVLGEDLPDFEKIDLEFDTDNFLRNYRRWKTNKDK